MNSRKPLTKVMLDQINNGSVSWDDISHAFELTEQLIRELEYQLVEADWEWVGRCANLSAEYRMELLLKGYIRSN